LALTKADFLVESKATDSFLGHNFAGGEEDAILLLEGFLGLKIRHLRSNVQGSNQDFFFN